MFSGAVLGISTVAPGYTLTASIGLIVAAVGLKMPAIFIAGFIPFVGAWLTGAFAAFLSTASGLAVAVTVIAGGIVVRRAHRAAAAAPSTPPASQAPEVPTTEQSIPGPGGTSLH